MDAIANGELFEEEKYLIEERIQRAAEFDEYWKMYN